MNNVEFRVQSFFNIPTENHEKLFDFIYDYTFLCSFHPSVRTQWAEKMFDLLKYNGELCTLIFPIHESKEGGPPYRLTLEIMREILGK